MRYQQLSAKLLGPMVGGNRSSESQLKWHRAIVLILTFIVYTTYHASRRPIAIVKGELHYNCSDQLTTQVTNDTKSDEDNKYCGWEPFDKENGKNLLGMLDSCYLFMYAFCMFVSGYFAERSNLRYFLSISLIICGVISIAMGLAHVFEIHQLWYFIVFQLAAGIAQTTGWPAVVAIVGEWFGNTKKGLILGIWNWHTSVGNIVGSAVASAFVDINWGLSFMVPGFICIGVAIIMFFILIPKPIDVGIQVELTPDDETKNGMPPATNQIHCDMNKNPLAPEIKEKEEAITIWKALAIPGVVEFSICLFFAKLVSYTFLFWLPMYLESTSHLTAASSGFQSIAFDIGGCLGSIIAGFLADRTGASALTCIVFLALAIPSLVAFYAWSTVSAVANNGLQFIAGAFVNGPYALITTAVSANLACKVPSKSAMATVSAIIDGTGSIGAAVGPLLAPLVSGSDQWINVFYMCIAADVVAILSLIRIGYEDYRRFRNRRKY
ncbi:hypothetical protein RDWZM_003198 [Blomia tropicalis]|uniref:Sugar phosphate exchanger 3 n=1 Tax=Blomia tropicalis TaxID=40697 RepID=A0A9Q0MGF4_BLOTA|nr:hypothetical protein RDWZM_003198 [Blomia tropicalis]